MDIQAKIPSALCCIHNIICRYDPEELDDAELQQPYPENQTDHAVVFGTLAGGFIMTIERDTMMAKQDEITEQLWEDHLSYLCSQ